MHPYRKHASSLALAAVISCIGACLSPVRSQAASDSSQNISSLESELSSPLDFNSFFEKAQAGDADAQEKVGSAYCRGYGVARDYRQGFSWLQKAAEQKNVRAESWLGWLYSHGLGVTRDETKAFQWYLAAANAGDLYAEMHVADGYAEGKGVAQDYYNSSQWYAKAAAQGNAEAALQLGLDYLNGQGVYKEPETAFKYFLEAASRNIRTAQYNLALCYWNGVFVQRDPVQAYKWCSLALLDPGDKDAPELFRTISKSLTSDQTKQGEAQIDEWLKERSGYDVTPPVQFAFKSGTSAVMPFEWKGNEILLKVAIDGHDNLKLAMDTGASFTSVDGICVSQYNIPRSSDYQALGGIGKETVLSNRTQNLNLDLPGLSINQVSLAISPAFWHIDGLLGYDILRNYVIKIDYVNKTVEFISPQSFDPKNAGTPIPCFIDHTRIMVKVKLKNNDSESDAEDFVMDTGCYNGLVVSQHFSAAHPQLAFTNGVESRSEGVGGMVMQENVPCAEAEFGAINVTNPAVSLVKKDQGLFTHLNGLIGNKVWSNYDVTIDYPNGKVYLKPNTQAPSPSEPPSDMPIAPVAPAVPETKPSGPD